MGLPQVTGAGFTRLKKDATKEKNSETMRLHLQCGTVIFVS